MNTHISQSRLLCVLTALLLLLAAGCRRPAQPQPMLRLDLALAAPDSLPGAMMPGLHALMAVSGASGADEAAFASAWGTSAATQAFAPAVSERLGSVDFAEAQFGELSRRLPGLLPDVRWPRRIYGIITPYNQSIVTLDTVMLIGLNHYLGADFEGYSHLPAASRLLKEPRFMAPDAARAVINAACPFDESAPRTLAQRMIHYGGVTLAIWLALPEVDDATLLGLSPEALDELEGQEADLWRAMAESGALWSSDRSAGRSLTVAGARAEAGGRRLPEGAVRMLALHMARAYVASHSPDSVSRLLAPSFYLAPDAVVAIGYAP